MWRKGKKYNSVIGLTLLLALASTPIAASIFVSQLAVAQTNVQEPSFPLPTSIPEGTTVKIDGSGSMARINDSLKQSFEQQYTGTKVELAANGTDAALKSLLDGKIDLGAIARDLTPAEQAQGLEQKRLYREKIAIVVSEDNPYKGNLTSQQFARIFRGEITDWSELGGKKGKIRFIDRPTSSDTREAFRNYPAFKTTKFTTASTATTLSQDDSVELVKKLGKDGIGYGLATQISKVPGVRVLKLHQTLPENPKYPFSQPLVYVYKKNPSPGVAGFLGFASAAPGTKAVDMARSAEANAVVQNIVATPTAANATATPATANSPVTGTEATTNTYAVNGTSNQTNAGDNKQVFVQSGENAASSETGTSTFPWWWLLPISALGAAGLWLLVGGKRQKNQELVVSETPATSGISAANTPEENPLLVNESNLINNTSQGATNLLDSTNSISNPEASNLKAVPLAGAAAGIGLWSRLGYGDIDDVPNASIPAEIEMTNFEEPAAVVIPPEREIQNLEVAKPVIDADLPNIEQPSLTTPIQTPEITDLQEVTLENDLPEIPEVQSPDMSPNPQADIPPVEILQAKTPTGNNLLNNISGVTLAGGAAAGAGLWSILTNNKPNRTNVEVEEQNLNLSPETPEVPQISSVPINNFSQPLPDVWDDTPEEPIESDRTWFGKAVNINPSASGDFTNRDNERENTEFLVENIASSELEATTASLETPEINLPAAEINPETPIVEITEVEELTPGEPTAVDAVADAAESHEDIIQASFLESSYADIPTTEIPATETPATTGLDINPGVIGGAALAGAGAAIWANSTNSDKNPEPEYQETASETPSITENSGEVVTPAISSDSTITLTARTPKWAYVNWDVADTDKQSKRQQGGISLALRLYDTTDIDLSYQSPQLIQQYECEETITDRFVAIPISDRDYMTEIGYLTNDNTWLPIVRSHIVRIFNRPQKEFWFEADAELIIHGATEPGSSVSIGGKALKLKEDGTFHLRIPFTDDLIDYVMTAVAHNGENAKTIHMHFSQDGTNKKDDNGR
ncbi:substrate-binding domain-containing protein [Calothrix sp. UHCC 0171]|uniref:substrate-binding domain-containing protein n=1 Tax=Calothrix sp. UHCC 0171 TaxID=3110245 RepID=UPI002B212AC3|nr:substrate-binding domain-containing protein [Calothrix sp. UHCC 0171]MEA5571793.1 substrate-binding domain-containing protein [Calothrix sp. UHCC 0171]